MEPANHVGVGDRFSCNRSSPSMVNRSAPSMAPLSRSSSFASVSSVSDHRAPRDLTTESLMTIDDKLRPKHRAPRHSSTIQKLSESRTSSLRSLQTDQRPSFRHSFSSSNLPDHRAMMAPTRQPARDPKGEYFFPNGEVFRPRQKPRNRSSRPHRTIYGPSSRSASVPNLEKHMREVSSNPSFTGGQHRPSYGHHTFAHGNHHDLSPPMDIANHQRSNSSSAASVNLAHTPSSSPSPKTETSASSIQNEESIVLELDLKKSLLEAENAKNQLVREKTFMDNTFRERSAKETFRERSAKETTTEVTRETATAIPETNGAIINSNRNNQDETMAQKTANAHVGPRPLPIKRGASSTEKTAALHNTHTERRKESVTRRPSLMSRMISKLFGKKSDKKKEDGSRKGSFLSLKKTHSAKVKRPVKQDDKPPARNPERFLSLGKEESVLPHPLQCDTADETRSFEQGDEPEALTVEANHEVHDALRQQDDANVDLNPTPEEILYFSKVIELGETPFPNLAEPDMGNNRRQKKRVQSLERKKSLNRNASLTSTHSSIKTGKTTGTNSSVNSFDLEEHFHDLHRYFRKGPSANDETCLSNVEIITSNEIKSPSTYSTPVTPCLRTSDFMTSRNSSYSSIFKADSKTSLTSNSSSCRQAQTEEPKKVSFSNKLYLNRALSPSSYDRFNCVLKEQYHVLSNTPHLIQDIRSELNSFKSSMEVHEASRQYTHYFHA